MRWLTGMVLTVLSITARFASAGECRAVFSEDRPILAELAGLRSAADSASDRTVARTLYAAYLQKFQEAKRLGLNPSKVKIEKSILSEQSARANEREKLAIAAEFMFRHDWKKSRQFSCVSECASGVRFLDANRLLYTKAEGLLIVRDLKTNKEKKLSLPNPALSSYGSMSTNRSRIALLTDERIDIESTVGVFEFPSMKLVSELSSSAESPVLSPDGSHVAVVSGDQIFIHDVKLERSISRLPRGAIQNFSMTFSPNGREVLVAGGEVSTRFDVQTGKALETYNFHMLMPAFSPDGETIAYAQRSGEVLLIKRGDAKPMLALTGHKRKVNAVQFSPRGDVLYTAGEDGQLIIWNALNGLRLFGLKLRHPIESFDLSADERSFAVSENIENGKRITIMTR